MTLSKYTEISITAQTDSTPPKKKGRHKLICPLAKTEMYISIWPSIQTTAVFVKRRIVRVWRCLFILSNVDVKVVAACHIQQIWTTPKCNSANFQQGCWFLFSVSRSLADHLDRGALGVDTYALYVGISPSKQVLHISWEVFHIQSPWAKSVS